MAEVRPFRGVHYNESVIKDWAAVICPPYDIISPQQQQELYLRSEYNFIRLEFGRELPQDTATDNRYTRAAATLEQWLKQGVLAIDEVPALYLHDQYFHHQGKKYQRRGLITCIRLEEWDRMVVRPHEGTMAEPRGDRLSLLWALQANSSPILAMFEDRGQRIASLLAAQERNKPLINLSVADGEGHTVWAMTEPGVIGEIRNRLAEQPVYVADGHHRYESALTYQRERRDCMPSVPAHRSALRHAGVSGDEAFNFVMMELVDFSDPGLLILPPHRLVRGISKSILGGLMAKLEAFFEVEELPLSMANVWERIDNLLADSSEIRIVLFGLVPERFLVLRLRDLRAVSRMMPYFHSDRYKSLDVSIIDHVILENLLASSIDKEKTSLAYSYQKVDAVNRVLSQEYQLALLLRPVKAEVVKAIADLEDKMPRKSTYFYPKLPAGLIFHRLV